MTTFDITLLAVAGFAAGTLNAIAGGGTIFTFSALLAIGVPPIAANATSATAVMLGSTASAVAYRQELIDQWERLLPLCLISILGGGVGALLLLNSDDKEFRSLVPWLLLLATMQFTLGPTFRRAINAENIGKRFRGQRWLATIVQGLVAVYGGYFGAGMGVMMLASLSLSGDFDYQSGNAIKNLLSIVIQSIAVGIFLGSGVVKLDIVLLIATTSIIGGWIGVGTTRWIPELYVRRIIVVSGLGLSCWYFFNQ